MSEELLQDDGLEMVELGADEELLSVLQDIGESDNHTVKVHRMRRGSKRSTFLFECSPQDFSLEFIRDNYGTGDYRVQVRQGNKMVANKIIGIEALPSSTLPQASGGVPAAFPGTMENPTMEKLMEMIKDQASDGKMDMRSMMDMQFKMMALMMNAKSGGGSGIDLAGIAAAITALGGLLKGFGFGRQQDNTETMLSMFMQGMNLGRDMDRGDDSTNGLLGKMVDQLGPVLRHAMTTEAPATAGRLPAPGQKRALPMSMSGQPGAPKTEDNMNLAIAGLIRPKLRELCEVAARAGDIDLYTDLVLDQLGDTGINMLMQWDNPPGAAVDQLAKIEPDILQYRPWFEALLANIRGVLEDEAADENLTAGEDGASSAASLETLEGMHVPTVEPSADTGQPPAGDGQNNIDS